MIAPNNDLLTYEQAAAEFNITVAQLRYLIKNNRVTKYTRGYLRGAWVKREEVARATSIQPQPPSDFMPDRDER